MEKQRACEDYVYALRDFEEAIVEWGKAEEALEVAQERLLKLIALRHEKEQKEEEDDNDEDDDKHTHKIRERKYPSSDEENEKTGDGGGGVGGGGDKTNESDNSD